MPNHYKELLNLIRRYKFNDIFTSDDCISVLFSDCNDFKDIKKVNALGFIVTYGDGHWIHFTDDCLPF